MSLEDEVEFDQEDMETTVEPLREVVGAIADAICTTIRYAKEDAHRSSVISQWQEAGDMVLRFMKSTER